MLVQRAQKAFAYLAVAVSVATLSLASGASSLVSGVMALALVTSWFWEPRVDAMRRQRVFWNVVLVFAIVFTAWQVVRGGQPVLRPTLDLVQILTVVKLFQRGTARDYQQLYVLSFLMMAVSSVLDDGLLFGGFFALWTALFAVGFGLCHLQMQLEARTLVNARAPTTMRLSGRALGLLGALAGALVVVSAIFFTLLPRLGVGVGAPSPASPQKVTGFAPTIDLSDHGLIGLDERPVMRVTLSEPVHAPYWRAMAYDTFDGVRWSTSPGLNLLASLATDAEGRFWTRGGEVRWAEL